MASSDRPENPGEKSLGRIIYTAPEPMVRLIKMIKRLSISTTLLSAGVQPFIYPKLIATGSSLTLGFAAVTCTGIVLSPLVLNWFTKRYVTNLYYDDAKDKFNAQHLNLLNRTVTLSYSCKEVQIPEALGIFTTFTVGQKKRPLFVDPNQVIDIGIYKRMLGFDKPIDLKRKQLLEEIEKLKQQQQKVN